MFTSYLNKKFVGLLLSVAVMGAGTGVSHASENGLFGGLLSGSGKGFTGLSIYTATGYQNATLKTSDVRVKGTNIQLPSTSESTHSTFWLAGLDYTYVFGNKFSLGAQIDYYPKSTQVALSISPGYEFNDWVLGYLRFGWASVPFTVDQGVGMPNYETRLDAYFAGIGAKVNIYRGIYGYAELRYSEVDRLTSTAVLNTAQFGPVPVEGSAKTTAINTFIGLGYRF